MSIVAVRWPDGKVQTAETWEDLEEQVRVSQYDIPAKESFREHMANRAKKWSGTEIMTSGTSNDFFWELERAGMLRKVDRAANEAAINHEPYVVDLTNWTNANKTFDPFAEVEEVVEGKK